MASAPSAELAPNPSRRSKICAPPRSVTLPLLRPYCTPTSQARFVVVKGRALSVNSRPLLVSAPVFLNALRNPVDPELTAMGRMTSLDFALKLGTKSWIAEAEAARDAWHSTD